MVWNERRVLSPVKSIPSRSHSDLPKKGLKALYQHPCGGAVDCHTLTARQ